MKYRSHALYVAIFALLFSSLLSTAAASPSPNPVPTHILVISLDGARPDGILQAETTNIQALAKRGAFSWAAQTVFPPATLPGHTSMLTGLDVDQHGVDWNVTPPNCPVIESPTFLTLAQQAGYQTGMVVGKEIFCQFRQTDGMAYTFAREGDRSVVDAAIEMLDEGIQVLFLQFPNPDYFGHSTGWMSDTYINEFYSTDWQIGRLLDYLDELELTDETLIILTADHGGHDIVHGSDIPEDMTIPWLITGPGVVAGTELTAEIHVTDTAATVLWALGIALPDELSGRPVLEAFGLSEAAFEPSGHSITIF